MANYYIIEKDIDEKEVYIHPNTYKKRKTAEKKVKQLIKTLGTEYYTFIIKKEIKRTR